MAMVGRAGVTAMLDTVAAETVSAAVSVCPPDKAVIVVAPAATAVAKPVLASIVATASSELVQ